VYSKPAVGTEFLVTLPKYAGELEEENEDENEEENIKEEEI